MRDQPTVVRLLSRRCRQVLRQRTRVLATGDRNAIHDLRVATRRLEEALEFLAPALPSGLSKRLTRRSRRIRRELGAMRNLDVLAELVARVSRGLSPAQRRVVAPLARRLAKESAQLRIGRAADRARDSSKDRPAIELPGIAKRVRTLGARVLIPAEFSMKERGRQVLTLRARDVEAALEPAGAGDAAALHTLRIAVKRYRYTLEILDQAGNRRTGRAIASARALQTRLGDLHDLDVFLELLPRDTSAAGRSLAALLASRRQRLLRRARRSLDSFDPKSLTRSVLRERGEGAAA